MLAFLFIAGYFRVVSGLFGTAAGAAEDIPLVGDTVAGPFRSIEGFFESIADLFDDLQDWAASIPFDVWDWATHTYPWLSDPVESLWEDIWDRITGAHAWLTDPEDHLWEPFRDRLLGAYEWLSDPVESLWDEIQSHFEEANPWILDPVEYIWEEIGGRIPEFGDITGTIKEVAWDNFLSNIDDWLVSWVEWEAETAVDLAGRALDIALGNSMVGERWSRWRSPKD